MRDKEKGGRIKGMKNKKMKRKVIKKDDKSDGEEKKGSEYYTEKGRDGKVRKINKKENET